MVVSSREAALWRLNALGLRGRTQCSATIWASGRTNPFFEILGHPDQDAWLYNKQKMQVDMDSLSSHFAPRSSSG